VSIFRFVLVYYVSSSAISSGPFLHLYRAYHSSLAPSIPSCSFNPFKSWLLSYSYGSLILYPLLAYLIHKLVYLLKFAKSLIGWNLYKTEQLPFNLLFWFIRHFSYILLLESFIRHFTPLNLLSILQLPSYFHIFVWCNLYRPLFLNL